MVIGGGLGGACPVSDNASKAVMTGMGATLPVKFKSQKLEILPELLQSQYGG